MRRTVMFPVRSFLTGMKAELPSTSAREGNGRERTRKEVSKSLRQVGAAGRLKRSEVELSRRGLGDGCPARSETRWSCQTARASSKPSPIGREDRSWPWVGGLRRNELRGGTP